MWFRWGEGAIVVQAPRSCSRCGATSLRALVRAGVCVCGFVAPAPALLRSPRLASPIRRAGRRWGATPSDGRNVSVFGGRTDARTFRGCFGEVLGRRCGFCDVALCLAPPSNSASGEVGASRMVRILSHAQWPWGSNCLGKAYANVGEAMGVLHWQTAVATLWLRLAGHAARLEPETDPWIASLVRWRDALRAGTMAALPWSPRAPRRRRFCRGDRLGGKRRSDVELHAMAFYIGQDVPWRSLAPGQTAWWELERLLRPCVAKIRRPVPVPTGRYRMQSTQPWVFQYILFS